MWRTNIEKETLRNRNWRKVLHTTDQMQVVVMDVPPRTQLGWENHADIDKDAKGCSDQFIRVEQGRATINTVSMVDGDVVSEKYILTNGMSTVIPCGTYHNVINDSYKVDLKFYTVYSPPQHPPDIVDETVGDELARKRME